jgi:hypothetical protein
MQGGYVSGDDVKGSESPNAQQFSPDGATTARAAGYGERANGEIRWVGEQHLMAGYCGRAVLAGHATIAAGAEPPRPVALLRRPRGMVVRIGPRPAPREEQALARAA